MNKQSGQLVRRKRSGGRGRAAESFFELSDAQKEREVAKYDREFIIDEARPLTRAERADWNRIKRKRGRPAQGRGAKVISVTVERSLLEKADALAKKKITRARLIARGLRAVLAAEGL
ncbi:MAG: hypothetical protein AB1716_06970 [Planctomycetota bacterium]